MNPSAKLSDLIDALEFESMEHHTYFDRHTGRIVSVENFILSAVEEHDEAGLALVSDWQKEEIEIARAIVADSGDRFIDPPDKFEFHEYHHMEQFIGSLSDAAAADALLLAIKGRGAFRRFKDTLYQLGIQDQWFRYRDEAMRKFVIAWAEANGVPYEDDRPARKA